MFFVATKSNHRILGWTILSLIKISSTLTLKPPKLYEKPQNLERPHEKLGNRSPKPFKSFGGQGHVDSTEEFWSKVKGTYKNNHGATVTFDETQKSVLIVLPSTSLSYALSSDHELRISTISNSSGCLITLKANILRVENHKNILGWYDKTPSLRVEVLETDLKSIGNDERVDPALIRLCEEELNHWQNQKWWDLESFSEEQLRFGEYHFAPSPDYDGPDITPEVEERLLFRKQRQ